MRDVLLPFVLDAHQKQIDNISFVGAPRYIRTIDLIPQHSTYHILRFGKDSPVRVVGGGGFVAAVKRFVDEVCALDAHCLYLSSGQFENCMHAPSARYVRSGLSLPQGNALLSSSSASVIDCTCRP